MQELNSRCWPGSRHCWFVEGCFTVMLKARLGGQLETVPEAFGNCM